MWMTHPTLPAAKVPVAASTFAQVWAPIGWTETTEPTGPAGTLDDSYLVTRGELQTALAGVSGGGGSTSNAAVAGFVTASGPTKTALDGAYGAKAAVDANTTALAALPATYAQVTDLPFEGTLGNALTKVGVIIPTSTSSSTDNLRTESLTTLISPENGRIAGVYTGYGDSTGVERASICLAWSDDGVKWAKAGTLLAYSGTANTPDSAGCTGPVLVYEGGTYYLFYIGLTATGYEGGTKTLCLATSPSLVNPVWTRRGAVMSPGGNGWRAQQVWHPSFIKVKSTWYCFINASGSDGNERIGYATAPALIGPWTFADANSPLIDVRAGEYIAGDPCVTRIPGGYRMDFFRASSTTAGDYYAVTSDVAFPLGWKFGNNGNAILAPTANSYDSLFAHKPWILRYGGRVFHYYTAVTTGGARRAALAVDPPLVPGLATLPAVTGSTTDARLESLLAAFASAGLVVGSTTPPVTATARDTFTRADSTSMGSTETGGFTWATSGAGWGISSNKARFSGSADQSMLVNTGVADNWDLQFTAVTINGQYPLGLAWGSSATSYVKVFRNQTDNQWNLVDSTGGTTQQRAVATDIAAGDVMRLRKQGGTITLFVNGAQTTQWTGVTLHATAADTFQGVLGSGGLVLEIDDWSLTPVS